MNKITEITKRDIYDLFKNGMEITDLFEERKITYLYYGRMEEIEFLKRLYDLEKMPSFDSRYDNAEDDIHQHTINNDDYSYGWVFEDERFKLKKGNDEVYLKFICEIFHPVVRYDKGYWNEFFNEVNNLLKNDGYELYCSSKISNRDVYSWRFYKNEEGELFIPYSQRNTDKIKSKKITLSITRKARNQIYQILEKNNLTYQKTDESGWNEFWTTEEEVFNNIKQFYTPKCYNDQHEYIETSNLKDFIYSASPFHILDTIEFFIRNIESKYFESKINTIFRLNGIPFKLENMKIINTYDSQMKSDSQKDIYEIGLQELLHEASDYYEQENYKIAVEKLWDALERLKTFFSPTLDKKKSIEKLIKIMSNDNRLFIELFDKEFKQLTSFGNDFRIRHHETTKIDIEDEIHYKYFYRRCISLISTAIEYLNANTLDFK